MAKTVHDINLGGQFDRLAKSLNTLQWMCRFMMAIDIIILVLLPCRH